MRKISILAIAGMLLGFAGCSLQMPEKVSVKTNADYNFAIGNIEKTLNFSTAIPGAYDYFPGSTNANLQQYLVVKQVYSEDWSSNFSSLPDGTIDLSSMNLGDNSQKSLGFNPSEITNTISSVLGSGFGSSIQFDAVPVYLYFDYSNGITVEGKMKIYYGDSSGTSVSTSSETYILGSAGACVNVPRCPVPSDLPTSTETVVTTDLKHTGYTGNERDANLASIMNTTVTDDNVNLWIDYDIQLGGTVTKSNGSVNAALSVYAIIVVPIKFNVSSEITMDLKALAGITGDLLGRSSASGNNNISQYTEAIRSVSFIYETQVKPFEFTPAVSGQEVKLWFDVNNNGSVADTEKHSFNQGAITLTADELEYIMNNTPYAPELSVRIPEGTFSIKRTKSLKMNLGIKLVTDGEIPLSR